MDRIYFGMLGTFVDILLSIKAKAQWGPYDTPAICVKTKGNGFQNSDPFYMYVTLTR